MNRRSLAVDATAGGLSNHMSESAELRLLFHRLNNQLGIILAHAELLEAKAGDDNSRARAAQVLSTTLDAMATAKEIRAQLEPQA